VLLRSRSTGLPGRSVERVREVEGARSVSIEEREHAQVLIVQTALKPR